MVTNTTLSKNESLDFKTLFDAVPAQCLILSPDFVIVAVTNEYLRATMTQREEIIGRKLFDVFPDNPTDENSTGVYNLNASLQKVLEKKIPDSMPIQKYDIRRPSYQGGEFEIRYWFPTNLPILDENDEIRYIIHRVEDVTDFVLLKRKTKLPKPIADEFSNEEKMQAHLFSIEESQLIAENKFRKSQHQIQDFYNLLKGIIEGAKDIIAAFDINLNVIYFNSSCAREYKIIYHKDIKVGDNILNYLAHFPGDQAMMNACLTKALENNEFKTIAELGGPEKSHHYEVNYYPLKDKNNRIVGVFYVSQNITERIRAENKIKENEAALLQANQELEAFSYSVSHDLRAPLRAIGGFSHILEEKYAKTLPDEAKHFISRISESALEMGNLIDAILKFSRFSRQSIKKQNVSMYLLSKTIAEKILNENSDKKINVSINPELPSCQADESLLKQVMINLISNAIKYTGKIENPHIQIDFKQENIEIIYFIKDNGVGFDMRYVDKLFKVFQRLQRAEDYEGTGVGLAIVERVIHRHGGRIWAEGKVGEGAAFYFTIGGEDEY
mgnify:FL=1